MEQDDYTELLEKYKAKVSQEFGEAPPPPAKVSSREYGEFKKELYPTHFSFYEKASNFSGNFLKLNPTEKKSEKMQKDLDFCHLNTTPSGVISFAILAALAVMVFGSLLLFAIPVLLGQEPMFGLVIFALIAGGLMIPALQKVPSFMANSWRMKASNQMVQAVFYLVTYMRHTSNIERAIEFAADHLSPPLSLDFRKILWDVETQRYGTIKDSAEAYLGQWRECDKEFVESFHLIESSLFEGSEERRQALLDKSLDVILNGTYENMLHYAHNLKGPMTMLHMLGIILPILGLVILPLVVSLMSSESGPFVKVVYISLLYNIAIPVGVFYLGMTILSKRPAGYGAEDITKREGVKRFSNVNIPLGKKISISVNPLYFSLMIFLVALIIGFSPFIMRTTGMPDFAFDQKENIKMLEYVCPPCGENSLAGTCGPGCDEEARVGPYGLGASMLSLLFIAGLGASIGLFFSLRSKNVIKIRNRTKELEDEFSSALFQLGNRLGDGLPAEIAFGKVAQTMQGSTSGDFFNLAEKNITKLGMGLQQAVFDPRVGAIASYPSKVIESSMKVLIESIKKGPKIAAQALLSMSRYIKEIHRVEERLKDLMADIISSMKSQVKFLTPAIAGIVIGITSMISAILTRLSGQLGNFAARTEGSSQFGEMLSVFGIGIPTFYFQIVIGIYIVEIVYILTVLASGIENGADKLGTRYELGKNLIKSTLSYCFIAGVVMLLFNLFAVNIIGRTGFG